MPYSQIPFPPHAADKLEAVVKICENHTTRLKIIPDYFKFLNGE